MAQRPDFAIDVERMVASKGGHLPGFVIRWMEKFLHLKEFNEFFVQGYEGVEFCTKALEYLDIKLEVSGLENVPDDGTLYTFVSNHPLGGIDGITLGSIVGQNYGGNVRYLVNDLLMHIKGLAPICVPINKMGGQSRELPRLIEEAFASDSHMIMFPAGLCSRKIDGRIQDIEWGKAFINKSKSYGRSVVPVHFIGQNSKRFYRVAAFCKTFHIKLPLAMLLLPDELFRQRHGVFKVVFGKPIPPEHFDKSRTPQEWAQWVRSIVYDL